MAREVIRGHGECAPGVGTESGSGYRAVVYERLRRVRADTSDGDVGTVRVARAFRTDIPKVPFVHI